MNRLVLIGLTLLGLAIAVPHTASAQSNPFVGRWQLNLAKSKYSPGPPPKSLIVNVQAEGRGLKAKTTGVNAEGNPINYTQIPVFDGLPHPVKGNPNQDAYASTREAYIQIYSDFKAGKLVGTSTFIVSPDGKTITATELILDANGKLINNIAVFDKQ
jgi:hypothetical protein